MNIVFVISFSRAAAAPTLAAHLYSPLSRYLQVSQCAIMVNDAFFVHWKGTKRPLTGNNNDRLHGAASSSHRPRPFRPFLTSRLHKTSRHKKKLKKKRRLQAALNVAMTKQQHLAKSHSSSKQRLKPSDVIYLVEAKCADSRRVPDVTRPPTVILFLFWRSNLGNTHTHTQER